MQAHSNILHRSRASLKNAYFARAILGVMIKDMIKNLLIGGFTLTLLGMYLLTANTSPSQAHPAIILLFFLLLYISILISLTVTLVFGSKLISRINTRRPKIALGYNQAYMIASILALAPVMLVAMSSVGGVSLREITLICLFEVIALFYLWKRR